MPNHTFFVHLCTQRELPRRVELRVVLKKLKTMAEVKRVGFWSRENSEAEGPVRGTGPAGTQPWRLEIDHTCGCDRKKGLKQTFSTSPPQTVTHPHTADSTHTCTQHASSRAAFPPSSWRFSTKCCEFQQHLQVSFFTIYNWSRVER